MDMDIDMDVPYSVSVFLIHWLLHPILERETPTHASSLPTFIPNADNHAAPTSELWGGYLFEQHHGVSGHGGYDSYGYAQPYYTHSQWQQSQSQIQRRPHSRSGYGTQYDPSGFDRTTPTPPAQPQAITGITIVVDTNVLLDYLMVIQKFVADIERMRWPSVVVIPNVVISELDWCVGPACARSCSN